MGRWGEFLPKTLLVDPLAFPALLALHRLTRGIATFPIMPHYTTRPSCLTPANTVVLENGVSTPYVSESVQPSECLTISMHARRSQKDDHDA
eukprot:47305-Eustigmatos_ZCMA.PRE.1